MGLAWDRDMLPWFYVWRAPVHIACRAFASTKLDLWIDLGTARDMLDNARSRRSIIEATEFERT